MIKLEYSIFRTLKDGSKDKELIQLLNDGWQIKSANGTIAYIEYVLCKPKFDEKEMKRAWEEIVNLGKLFDDDNEKEEHETKITDFYDTEIKQ
jgi:hypothetical protein